VAFGAIVKFLSVLPLLFCGCQIQINVASSVVNIPVVKTQHDNKNSGMSGSDLKESGNGLKQKGGDLKASPY
jgi:hypothetical protein